MGERKLLVTARRKEETRVFSLKIYQAGPQPLEPSAACARLASETKSMNPKKDTKIRFSITPPSSDGLEAFPKLRLLRYLRRCGTHLAAPKLRVLAPRRLVLRALGKPLRNIIC